MIGFRTPSTRLVCSGYAIEPRDSQVADRESKLAAAATTLYNLARAVAPKFTDDTPEWSRLRVDTIDAAL